MRLADGLTEYEGRVELCENGVWGSICNHYNYYYYSPNAYTVCRELGYQSTCIMHLNCILWYSIGGVVLSNSQFGVSANPIFIHYMSCGTLESDLENCYQRRTHNWDYCNNYHEFTVRCESEITQFKVAF